MKKSFTLIEILISITILSVLFLALSNVIAYLSNSSVFISKNYEKSKNNNRFLKILYYDLLNADEVAIRNTKNYSFVKLRTSNSLYRIPKPYVIWYVSKNKNSLMRLESSKDINITDKEDYYLDKFAQNVKIFKIYKKDGKYFVYLNKNKPIYFEMYKGF